jgi:uncharacterized protein YmfQ (DUF2313 family)
VRPVALPRDRAEVDVSVTGSAGALVEWALGAVLLVGSRALVPTVRSHRLDGRGQGTVRAITVLAAEPEDLAVGASVSLESGELPAGVTLGTVAAVRAGRTGAFARELAYALGPAIQPIERSRINAELIAYAAPLAVTFDTQDAIRAERFPDTATQLLGAWETRLRLPVSPTRSLTDRRALALAKLRGAFGGPESRVLSAIRAIDPGAAIINGLSDDCTEAPKWVYLFAVTMIEAVFDDEGKREQLRAIVRQMAPAHALFGVGVNSSGFRCDDAASRTDVDFLGG